MSTSAAFSANTRDFLHACAQSLTASANNPDTRAASVAVAHALANASTVPFESSTVPVVAAIDGMNDTTLIIQHRTLLKKLPWTPSFRSDDNGQCMALCNANSMFELGKVRVGFVLVDANCAYPEHEHAPQEAYFIISGTGEWRYGGNQSYEVVAPGRSLYNHPMDRHGIKALDEPILAMYALWPPTTPPPASSV